MDRITEEDLNSLKYFWRYKGDITRWCDWEKKLPVLRVQFPEIVAARENYQTAIRILNACIENAEVREGIDVQVERG